MLYTLTLTSSTPLPVITMEQELDSWIEQLSDCKQLSEDNVKKLCEKVGFCFACAAMITATEIYAHSFISSDSRNIVGGV